MSYRNSGSEEERVARSVEYNSKGDMQTQHNSNNRVDHHPRHPTVSQSPAPRYDRGRDRSRSPYRHPTEPRGEKRRHEDHPHRDNDRADHRRFRTRYEDGPGNSSVNDRPMRSYADLDYGDAFNNGGGDMRGGGHNNNRNYNQRNRSPGRGNGRGGNEAGRGQGRERWSRNDRHDRHDRQPQRNDNQGSYRRNGNRGGGGGYNNGQNGFPRRNSQDHSQQESGRRNSGEHGQIGFDQHKSRDYEQDGLGRGLQDHFVSNQGDPRSEHRQPDTATAHKSKAANEAPEAPKVDIDEDFDPSVLVDQEAKEAAKIAARRAARAAIKAKHAAEEAAKNKVPSLLHLVLDGTVSVPPSSAVSTPADGSERSGSPTTPAVDTPAEADDTGSPAVIEVNGEGAAIEQEEKYHPISLNDNTTAANYDPTADREKDRLREESKAKEEGQAKERRKVKKDFDMFADSDDDDEMSGSDTPTNAQSSSPGPSKPLQLDASLLSNWDDPEGYYKIRPHELLDSRYEVIEQLGKGTFAEVVRAKDIETEETVAIKIVRNNDTMRKAGLKEIGYLKTINENDPSNKKHVVRFRRHFDHKRHLCMVFENLKMSLREVLKKNEGGVTLDAVRVYAHQILIGLDYLHKQGLIHADFKPDNLLVNENDQVLKICDLGSACELHETYDLTAYLASRFYRAPEIILGIKYDYAIDMWAVGCTLFEFWTGKILFQGETNNQMLRAMMEVRGKFSLKLLKKGAYSGRFFNDDESFMSVQKAPFGNQYVTKNLKFSATPAYGLRSRVKDACKELKNPPTEAEIRLFVNFLDKCLALNPDKRITAADALKDQWFQRR